MNEESGAVREFAPAKLNLTLHICGQRADGYHLLDSLVAFVGIGDELHLSVGPLSLEIDGPFSAGLEIEGNLCLRAAELAGGEAQIGLTKNLPVASGIGGGSGDAAAVLRGLAQMGYAMPDQPEALGADIPVCVHGKPARMRGIGEIIEPAPAIAPMDVVLVNPRVEVSTPMVYRSLTQRDNAPMAETLPDLSTPDTLIAFLGANRNDLQAPAILIAPVIGDVLTELDASGAVLSRMSGSGATCFGLFDNAKDANNAATKLAGKGWWAVATKLETGRESA